MSEVMTKPKNKGGRPRKVQAVEGHEFVVAPKKDEAPDTVYGWKVSEGFSRIMLFANPVEGKAPRPERFCVGEHPPVLLYKNKMHVVPNAIMYAILDTHTVLPEDDTSDSARPRRMEVDTTYLPHSDPVPATWQEYKAYRDAEEAKPTAAQFTRDTTR